MKKKLWTKDFSRITFATVLSAIGGEAMSLPVSLLVFDETNSTFWSALVMICGMLPDVLFPVLIAPLIDKGGKKRWIVGLDMLLAVLYAGMGLWISGHEFRIELYLAFVLIVGSISLFYRLAYTSWYPDLIPNGLEQKGYAVSSMLYPLVIIVMSPTAAFLYTTTTMQNIFFMVAGITLLSVLVESGIGENRKSEKNTYTLQQYCADIRESFAYLKREKGIRNIYMNMGVIQGTSDGMGIITQAYYQTQPFLMVTMLGWLISAEMIGRLAGGFIQYKKEIPVKKRYVFTKFVYLFYSTVDMIILFLPYPAMLISRFACGGLGISSATIRETAIQSYLPENMRARVNAFFSVLFAIGGVLFQFLAGMLGQVVSYRIAALILGGISIASILFFIILPDKVNRPVYEAVRRE